MLCGNFILSGSVTGLRSDVQGQSVFHGGTQLGISTFAAAEHDGAGVRKMIPHGKAVYGNMLHSSGDGCAPVEVVPGR